MALLFREVPATHLSTIPHELLDESCTICYPTSKYSKLVTH
jgi:hypothetical protein